MLLLPRRIEGIPRQLVDIPGMLKLDVGKADGNGPMRLGKARDVKVRAQGDCGGNGRLMSNVNTSLFGHVYS